MGRARGYTARRYVVINRSPYAHVTFKVLFPFRPWTGHWIVGRYEYLSDALEALVFAARLDAVHGYVGYLYNHLIKTDADACEREVRDLIKRCRYSLTGGIKISWITIKVRGENPRWRTRGTEK